jgi:uncharacterized membrane protein
MQNQLINSRFYISLINMLTKKSGKQYHSCYIQKIKYLRIISIMHMKMSTMNWKLLKKEIRKTLKHKNSSHILGSSKLTLKKMYIPLKVMYIFSAMHVKMPMSLFKQIGKPRHFPEQKEQCWRFLNIELRIILQSHIK